MCQVISISFLEALRRGIDSDFRRRSVFSLPFTKRSVWYAVSVATALRSSDLSKLLYFFSIRKTVSKFLATSCTHLYLALQSPNLTLYRSIHLLQSSLSPPSLPFHLLRPLVQLVRASTPLVLFPLIPSTSIHLKDAFIYINTVYSN